MAATLAWALALSTPLLILLFLMCFLVWMGQGRYDNRFTRFCDAMLVPAGVLVVISVVLTLRYF